MVFEQMVSIVLKEKEFDTLNEREMKLLYEIIDNPKKHVTHTISTHNKLCSENKRCILCMMESELIKTSSN